VSTEALRARALLALSPHADPRAHDVLARGEVVVVHGVAAWAGAMGPVVAHRVGLGLPAYDLACLVDAHSARDAIVTATAAAVASEEGNALAELVFFWSPAAQVEAGHYRGAMSGGDLGSAVVDFLRGRGEQAAEAFARTARFTVQGDEVRIEPTPPAPVAEPLQECLRALLARIDG
jgi:hypothetical protein